MFCTATTSEFKDMQNIGIDVQQVCTRIFSERDKGNIVSKVATIENVHPVEAISAQIAVLSIKLWEALRHDLINWTYAQIYEAYKVLKKHKYEQHLVTLKKELQNHTDTEDVELKCLKAMIEFFDTLTEIAKVKYEDIDENSEVYTRFLVEEAEEIIKKDKKIYVKDIMDLLK